MLDAAYKDTLYVIADEMKVTLSDIKSALEIAIDTKDNKHLRMVRELLHSAKGALEVINFNASALLASEMISVVELLLDGKVSNRDQSLDAISSGVILLPIFFSKTVESEGTENSIALLPILQELRAARHAQPLSEDTLSLLDIKGGSLSDKTVQMPALSNKEDLRLLIGKYRPVYQTSLLGWIKDAKADKHLARLAVITEKFEQAAQQERSFKVWWVSGGLIEALIEGGLKSSPELRRLLGQVDRAGKVILDKGETYYQENTDRSLINQLLYFIGRSTTSGKRVSEIRKAFSLNESLPLENKFDDAKAAMAAPDTEVMHSLSLAIREDLDMVKDALDIFNRTGSKENLQIEKRFESLKKIADTLQMLGLDELEKRVLDQQRDITEMLSRNAPLTDNHLISVAASLLQVESRLEEELDKLAGKKEKDKPKYLLDALEATFREAKVNLARVKEVINQFMRDPTDVKPISRAPLLLKEARVAVMMADKERLALVLGRLQDYITRQLIGSGRLPYSENLDLLAGAIESVDFYLETLNKGRRDPWYMLDNADTCLEQLLRDAPKPLPRPDEPGEDEIPEYTITQHSLKVPVLDLQQGTGTVAISALSPETLKRMTKQTLSAVVTHPDAYPIMDQDLDTDPEVIEIFLEEANEVHHDMQREFQAWRADDTQREALVSVRRGFHTLKGSGRMVGARRLSELAWQAEHLINRVLEGTILADEDGLHLLERAVTVIPSLIEQIESGAETKEDAHQLMLSLESLIEQKLTQQTDRSEATYLPGQLGTDPNISDAQMTNKSSSEQHSPTEQIEGEDEKPQTQIIDMRSLINEFPAEENPYTQIMDMRKIMAASGDDSLESLLGRDLTDSPQDESADDATENREYRLEPTLYDIYTDESAKHLEAIREFCRDSVGTAITNKMHRAVHTLHGSANMADLTPIMNLSGELEHFIQRLYDEGLPLDHEASATVEKVADTLESMIATINKRQPMLNAPESLIQEVHVLRTSIDISADTDMQLSSETDDVDQRYSAIDEILSDQSDEKTPTTRFADQDETSDSQLISEGDIANLFSETKVASDAGIFGNVPDATNELVESATNDSDLDTVTQRTLTDADILHTTNQTDELLDELEVELDDILIVADADATDENKIVTHAPTMLAVDSEITNIFLEEAEEIIAQTDDAMATWDEHGLTEEKNIEMQRYLHTLKGGARMAGLLSIGEFTHELESFVIALKNNALEQNEDTRKVMQSAVDQLHSMLAEVQEGKPPSSSPEILNAMQALMDGTYDASQSAQESVDELASDVAIDDAQSDEARFSDVALSSIDTEAGIPSDLEEIPSDISTDIDLAFQEAALFDDTYAEDALPEQLEVTSYDYNETVDSDIKAPDVVEQGVTEIGDSFFEYSAEVVPVQQRQQDAARISTSKLETLLNQAGEISIFRSRIEQELSNANLNLAELARTVKRVKEQLRKMEIETEATILYQHRDESDRQDFDPLEMDRYSNVQQVSRALAESVNDLQSLETLLEIQFRDTEALLLQQSRVMTDLQDNLMRVRMIPFARYAPRYARIVRQIATETGKEVELNVIGADSEIDRQVIERMQAPLEHMIRNAIIHGIESPADRTAAGKDPEGAIELHLSREGAQLLLELKDDGAGLNLDRIREKALSIGLLTAEQEASDTDIAQLILNTGLTTADSVTQSAGRGVGMDVVASEIKQLGGSLQIVTEKGKGTSFLMRLPFTRAINHALMVRVGEENYAIPIHKIDGVAKMSLSEVRRLLASENPVYHYANQEYTVKNLAQLVGSHTTSFEPDEDLLSVIMVTGGDHHAALVVSELLGSHEMVIKPVGPQIAAIRGISGATILGDGQIVIILDMDALLGVQLHEISISEAPVEQPAQPLILVVDDSITVRRVTERLLERNKMQVITARDGLDALNILQEHAPDLILMDIEMPRMDGYELAEHVRKDDRFKEVPIIMITSRTGDKHRNRAMEIGVDDYLGKPYREDQLLEAIQPHLTMYSVN